MTMKKRLLSALLCLVVVLGLMPGALAAEPGDWVELSYGPLGLSGTYDVVSAESRGGPEGATTTIILEEP